MKCCMHYHSMGIIKIYYGKSQENLKKLSSRASKLQQEGLPPTGIFLRMALHAYCKITLKFNVVIVNRRSDAD